MTDFMTPTTAIPTRSTVRGREGIEMLLHEALARSRHQEAVAAAQEYALARQFTAGRRWASLAGYAARRAERARSAVDRGARTGVRTA
jgi:hypothetical protein